MGGFDSHALPPAPSTRRLRAVGGLLVALAFVIASPRVAAAQRPDTLRRAAPPIVDSLQPPLSPRRAFLYSFLVPGYSQTVLRRHKTAAGFLLFEGMAIAMIRESAADVHEARRGFRDTLVVSYVDAFGGALSVPDTITPRFGSKEVRSRQSHVEDWIAILVANHLFAGADAYVASHLWDVAARVGLRLAPQGAALTASITW